MPALDPALPRFDAILLTGGSGRRLGGVDKTGLLVGAQSLAARVAAAAAVAGAARLVVVGSEASVESAALVTREDPPGGGPVAAVAAGMALVTAPVVAVLAGDQPFLTAATVTALRMALARAPGAAAAMPVDTAGRDQPLCSLWRSPALRAALVDVGGPGVPVRRLVEGAPGGVVRLGDLDTQDGQPPPWFDCDTPTDLAAARQWDQDVGP